MPVSGARSLRAFQDLQGASSDLHVCMFETLHSRSCAIPGGWPSLIATGPCGRAEYTNPTMVKVVIAGPVGALGVPG